MSYVGVQKRKHDTLCCFLAKEASFTMSGTTKKWI